MVKHTLREGLSLCIPPQVSGETEGLHDRKVGLHCEHGSSRALLLADDLASALVEATVNSTDSGLWTLNLDCQLELGTMCGISWKAFVPRYTGSWRPGVAKSAAA